MSLSQDSDRQLEIDLLAGLFGISGWLSVNAMFNQLPMLVQSAPEGWNLPSYLTIIIQIANIGPILYYSLVKTCPRLVSDRKLIYCFLLLGSVCLIFMGLYYDHTWVIGENEREHSVVLFILAFGISLVGCMSSVLFIPFMNNFPEMYLVSYMVGEGFSGLLPSIISLVQGVGGNPSCVNSTTPTGEVVIVPYKSPPHFSSTVYFLIIFSIMALSTLAMFLLNNLPSCQKQKLKRPRVINNVEVNCPNDSLHRGPELQDSTPSLTEHKDLLSPLMYVVMLSMETLVSVFYHGVLPSVQSFSCLPYGNVAYHLAVNFSNMANPLACFLAFFVPSVPLVWMSLLTFISGVPMSYVLIMATLSPNPPLQGTHLGVFLIVLNSTVCSGLISFVKMSIAAVFRHEGGEGLFWFGCATQLGAAIGSSVMFYLINDISNPIFTTYYPCT